MTRCEGCFDLQLKRFAGTCDSCSTCWLPPLASPLHLGSYIALTRIGIHLYKTIIRVMALLDKQFRNACKPIINSLERTPDIVNGEACAKHTSKNMSVTGFQSTQKYPECV